MKKLLLLITTVALVSGAGAQSYYYIYHAPGSGNPAGLNTDNDNSPGDASGWQPIFQNSAAGYSQAVQIPFSFEFNNELVTEFKASSTGYITFDVAASNTPTSTSEALPSVNLPDKTISIWGMEATGVNDMVSRKTFGERPFRQHWIRFMSMSTPGNNTSYSYWSIVLEETTNKIYVVEQYAGSTSGSGSYSSPEHTIGIQLDGFNAVQVTGSPGVTRGVNSYLRDDNAYYEFRQGVQPMYDLGIKSINAGNMATRAKQKDVHLDLINMGSEDIIGFTVNYSYEKGQVYTDKVIGIVKANGGRYDHILYNRWMPSAAGKYGKIKVWITDVNNNGLDEVANNDVASKLVFINTGATVNKKALIDETTATWCGHCPDEIPYLNQVKDAYGDSVIIVFHHHAIAPNQGMFTNPQSDILHGTYVDEYPNTMVDRAYQEDRAQVSFSRLDKLNERVEARVGMTSPVSVSIIDKHWNPTTREITFTVKAQFVDYTLGKMRIGAYVVEDNMRGVGQGYDQIIYNQYVIDPKHMFYGYKNPMVGYIYPNVVRDIPSGPFGSPNSIPDNPVALGAVYTQTYTYVLPPEMEFNVPETSDFEPTGNIIGYNKIADVMLVGFVIMDDPDINKREIVNATSEPMFNFANSVTALGNKDGGLSLYPNPTSGRLNINFTLPKTTEVTFTVTDALGKTVKHLGTQNYTNGIQSASFDLSNLEKGIYFIRMESADGKITLKKFILI